MYRAQKVQSVAWSQTVQSLLEGCPPVFDVTEQAMSRTLNFEAPEIEVIEQLSPQTILVSWRGSMVGRRDDQIWRLKTARRPGKCLVTGRLVRRGDHIYQPMLASKGNFLKTFMMLVEAAEFALHVRNTASIQCGVVPSAGANALTTCSTNDRNLGPRYRLLG